ASQTISEHLMPEFLAALSADEPGIRMTFEGETADRYYAHCGVAGSTWVSSRERKIPVTSALLPSQWTTCSQLLRLPTRGRGLASAMQSVLPPLPYRAVKKVPERSMCSSERSRL